MNEQAQEIDPLTQAAGGIEPPKFPVLMPNRICQFNIVKASIDPVQGDESKTMLTLALATEKDYTDKEGKPLRKGFKVFYRIGLYPMAPTDTWRGKTMQDVAAELGLLLRSVGKTSTTPRQLIDNPTLIEGEKVDCKVGLNKAKDGYPESNRVTFVPPK
jgi:hypothetical protein